MVERLLAPSFIVGCLMLLSPAAAVIPISDLFPFGVNEGDSTAPPADDSFAGPIQLRHPFPFFNTSERTLFVNNNGAISFVQGVSQFTATCGAVPANLKMVAPFWADVNNNQGLGGAVYYRETTDRGLQQKAARDIQAAFPNLWGLNIGWLFISTWHDAPYYGANGCHSGSSTTVPRNTFQTVLATDGVRSFAILLYNSITWTSGTASGATNRCTGIGGMPAKSGFDVGDGRTFFVVPGSCSPDIITVDDRSNVGVPGKWIFRIDNSFESTACDSGKYLTEKLHITPSFTTLFGSVPIIIKGPCLNPSVSVTCRFNDPNRLANEVTGTVILLHGTTDYVAMCMVPILYSYGRMQVDLIVQATNSIVTYTGYLYVTEPKTDVALDIESTDDGEWDLIMNWDPSYYGNSGVSLSLVLLEFNESTRTWENRGIVADNIGNTGHSTLTIRPVQVRSFITFSLQVGQTPSGLPTTSVSKGSLFTRLISYLALFPFDSDALCQAWYENDDGPPRDILPCPPLLEQAQQDERFERDGTGILLNFYHPGAEDSFRQRIPNAAGAGQQCTYVGGQLLLGPPGGGTADAVSPASSFIGHMIQDILPWYKCCAFSDHPESCRKYYEKRPSDTGSNYVPPRPARGTGDPHITTFDLITYTFNGVGEFWMVKSANCSMQARMEQYLDPSGALTPASVFTAFVIHDTTLIQVQLSQASGMDVLLDGELVAFDGVTSSLTLRTTTASISISSDQTQVAVSLATGFTFEFTAAESSLSITATASDANKEKTAGLLGFFDGNPANDLQAPNGHLTAPTASLNDIHYNFGLKWMINREDSLFVYASGQNYDSYSNPSFRPNLLSPNMSAISQEVRDLCRNSLDCVYDYSTTGSSSLASLTQRVEQTFTERLETLNQRVIMCPQLPSLQNGYTNVSSLFPDSVASFGCNDDYHLAGEDTFTCRGDGQWNGQVPACVIYATTIDPDLRSASCDELFRAGFTQSGVYTVYPRQRVNVQPFEAFCDMETDGGGWTVIQRRTNASPAVQFRRKWLDYKSGFGNVSGEFWLGNDQIFALTNQCDVGLRVELEDWDGRRSIVTYSHFSVGDKDANYKTNISGYQGDGGNSIENGAVFATSDRNDRSRCARAFSGGWWYPRIRCQGSINGLYYTQRVTSAGNGVVWASGFRGKLYSLKRTEMKVRPASFP